MLFKLSTIAALLVAATSAAPTVHPSAIFARQSGGPAAGTVITKCTQSGVIAVTFDDGPGQYGAQLLQLLNQANVKATFFVTGTLYGCIYNRAQQVKDYLASGHQVASHTWTHANLQNLGTQQIQTEMSRLETAFKNILGKKPTYMRPPNGAAGGQVPNVMRQMGYRVINWDVDSGDWNNVGLGTSQQRYQQAGSGGQGHIVLNHETVAYTVQQLVPWVINWAKQNNLRMVTVAECLGDTTGGLVDAPGGGGGSC
ncbi:chitin deacetylase-like protein [Ascobolus immersus RN42]|uniref:Chitin deacetylase-like protein n=1 Tax=Ascobolus immersus RN42 TaxID=1160509 RepID=A0A3N4I271_ASCIM|nr:chitin deacetylase-like protein [Ascobolus immersus RN42]